MTDTALIPARNRLTDTITNLIDPKRVILPTGRHTWLDSVYQQLTDAAYEKHALGGGRTQPASPLWIDATDTLRAIDTLARVEHPDNPGFDSQDRHQKAATTHPTVLRLQAIDKRRWRPQDTEHVNQLRDHLDTLTLKAEHLLTPSIHWHLPNPCPDCGATHVHTDDNGELVRRPALELSEHYCRCTNPDCDGYWPSSRFQWLGRRLGNQPPEGVITA